MRHFEAPQSPIHRLRVLTEMYIVILCSRIFAPLNFIPFTFQMVINIFFQVFLPHISLGIVACFGVDVLVISGAKASFIIVSKRFQLISKQECRFYVFFHWQNYPDNIARSQIISKTIHSFKCNLFSSLQLNKSISAKILERSERDHFIKYMLVCVYNIEPPFTVFRMHVKKKIHDKLSTHVHTMKKISHQINCEPIVDHFLSFATCKNVCHQTSQSAEK